MNELVIYKSMDFEIKGRRLNYSLKHEDGVNYIIMIVDDIEKKKLEITSEQFRFVFCIMSDNEVDNFYILRSYYNEHTKDLLENKIYYSLK